MRHVHMGSAERDRQVVVDPYTLTPERIAASLAAVVGLVGAVVGGLALARARRTG